MEIDGGALAAAAVRFCGTNTGDEGANNWGEVICITDGSLSQAGAGGSVPEVRLFVPGSPALAMPDNIAFQPGRGNWVVREEADTNTALQGPHNNDLWDCLPDGTDPNLQSDGCVRIATLNDLARAPGALQTERCSAGSNAGSTSRTDSTPRSWPPS